MPRGKRLFDLAWGLAGGAVTLPVVACAAVLLWAQDRGNPLYVAERIGKGGRPFRLIKLRTMVVGADRTLVDTTIEGDPRVTRLGRFLRRYKIDEFPQFWLVLSGAMAVVGPRPNVRRETVLYTDEERRLLSVRPGLTDLSSIVFSDLAERLAGVSDANLAYNQRIRPWKSQLGLLYIDHASVWLDLRVVLATAVALISRRRALGMVEGMLRELGADTTLIAVALHGVPPPPAPPPGSTSIVTSR